MKKQKFLKMQNRFRTAFYGLIIICTFIIVSFIISLILINSFDPLSVEIPNGRERFTNVEFREAVTSLTEKERLLLNQFFANWDRSGGGKFPIAFTVGAAIDMQEQVNINSYGSFRVFE